MQLVKDTPLGRSLLRLGQSAHLELRFNWHALYSNVVLRRLWSACNFGPGTTYMHNYSCNYLQLQYHANAGPILEQHIVKIRPMPYQYTVIFAVLLPVAQCYSHATSATFPVQSKD